MQKFHVVILGLAILLALGVFYGFSGKTEQGKTQQAPKTSKVEKVQQEAYVSKIVVSAPWGEKNLVYDKEAAKPGEFGLRVLQEESPAVGPSAFAIAPNGDIYISDPLNKRIQRFSLDGDLLSVIPMNKTPIEICVDKNGNLYVSHYGAEGFGCIKKYGQDGKSLISYPVFSGIASTGNPLYCDQSDRIFVAARGVGIFQVGTTSSAFSAEQQEADSKEGFLGSNTAALNKGQFFQTGNFPGVFYLVSLNGDTLRQFRLATKEGWIPTESFFGTDASGAIYAYRSDRKERLSIVRKYDEEGRLIASIQWKRERTVGGLSMNKKMILDENGSIYVYIPTTEGIKIIKWYKQ